MGNILDWAKREIDIACKRENPNGKGNLITVVLVM